MLNSIKADYFRLFGKPMTLVWIAVLLVLPPVVFAFAGSHHEASKMLPVVQIIIYFIFFIVGIALSESIFGEERRLGLYKNDTTGGVSRVKIFLAKYIASAALLIVLWSVCSLICAGTLAISFGGEQAGKCFTILFSASAFWWLCFNLFHLAFFQTLRIFINKTSLLILVYALINTLFTQLAEGMKKLIPALGDFFNAESIGELDVLPLIGMFAIIFVGIAVVLFVGTKLFKRSEF